MIRLFFFSFLLAGCVSGAVSTDSPAVGSDSVRDVYSDGRFTWSKDVVTEGDNHAEALSEYEIVTTCLSKDGKTLGWKRRNDISPYGTYKGANLLETALYNMSVDEMINNFEADGTLRTGLLWGGVWTRDVSYSSLLALSYMCPQMVRNSLEVKIDRLGRVIQDTGTGGSWPCSTDRMAWALSSWNVYLATGDAGWLEKSYETIARSIESDFVVAYNPQTGLFRGESSFIDWREQSYPVWMQPADIYMSECLGTNAVFYETLVILDNMAQELGYPKQARTYRRKASDLKKAINRNFWLEEEGFYANYLYGRDNLSLSKRSETLGESFCILFGIADEEKASRVISSMHVGEYGPPIFSPQIASQGNYHNNAVWPYVTSFWGKAAAMAGNEAAVLHALACNVRTAALYTTNYENFTFSTGNPYTTLMNSPNMLWGLSGFMGLFHRVFFGFTFTQEGLCLNPFIPTVLAGERSLTSFPYRDMLLDIKVSGSGSRIESCLIDGKPSDAFIPADWKGTHTVEIVMGGAHEPSSLNFIGYVAAPEYPLVRLESGNLVWDAVEGAVAYKVMLDGDIVAQTAECRYAAGEYGEYQVVSVDGKGLCSFASEPLRYYSEASVQTMAVDCWLSPEHGKQLEVTVDVPKKGWYVVDFEYANGNGEYDQRNCCATRQLCIDGKDKGSVVFPQRGLDDWTSYGRSNSVKVYMSKGVHALTLEHVPANVNMNIDKDKAHVKEVRIVRL
jgi:hypothetical protein